MPASAALPASTAPPTLPKPSSSSSSSKVNVVKSSSSLSSSSNKEKKCQEDTSRIQPGTSSSSSGRPPQIQRRPKAFAALRMARALAMFDSFDRSYHSYYRVNISDVQNSIIERMDSLVNSLAALSPSTSTQQNDCALRIEQRREASRTLNAHLICLQSASCAARDIAAQQAAVVFEEISKHRPQEVKVKRGKATKKERKEKEAPTSSKSDRTIQREKASASKQSSITNHVDGMSEAPVTNNRVVNKRRSAQTPSTTTPVEKKAKKENGVKKRTSNRLSKTPRAKAKEEDEPTYCFCSRISFGEMIGCDNDKCEIEWFHFECIGLTTKPKGKWFCPNCRHPDSARIPKAARAINVNSRNNNTAAVEKV